MMNLLEKLKTLKETFIGMYRGVVVDNEGTKGRIKVKIYPMMEGLDVDSLPWAMPAMPVPYGGGTTGIYALPNVGSTVWVFFEGGDIFSPIYFASAPAGDDWHAEAVNGVLIITTPSGHTLKVDDNKKKVVVAISGDAEVTVAGAAEITVADKADITCGGECKITGDKIKIDGGSGDLSGVITGLSICHLTGFPHGDPSKEVEASKGG